MIILSGGTPTSNLNRLRKLSTSLKSSVDIWTVGSGPESSSQYLRDMATSSDQTHQSTFFENLSPFTTTITTKICAGNVVAWFEVVFFHNVYTLVSRFVIF